MTPEKGGALLRQYDMARRAGLGLPDRQRAGIRIEVADLQPGKLAVAAAGLQPGAHQSAEFHVAGIQQPLRLSDG